MSKSSPRYADRFRNEGMNLAGFNRGVVMLVNCNEACCFFGKFKHLLCGHGDDTLSGSGRRTRRRQTVAGAEIDIQRRLVKGERKHNR